MKTIIDTNCLIASIPRKNPEFWLYKAFENNAFEWIISNEISLEYEEKVAEFYSPLTAELVLNILSVAPNVTFSEPYIKWNLIIDDPDDNKFADLAISSNANYLVTNDHHFDVLKTLPFPTVKVISLEEFRKILGY
jgi:putative PIN family toxin of toxin-antitoxin system